MNIAPVSNLRGTSYLFVCLFESYQRPCSAHAVYIGTDRSLLTGHDALLLRQIARDLLHTLSHKQQKNSWTAFGEPPLLNQSSALVGAG